MKLEHALKYLELIMSANYTTETKPVIDAVIQVKTQDFTLRFTRPNAHDLERLFYAGDLFLDKFHIVLNGKIEIRNRIDAEHWIKKVKTGEWI